MLLFSYVFSLIFYSFSLSFLVLIQMKEQVYHHRYLLFHLRHFPGHQQEPISFVHHRLIPTKQKSIIQFYYYNVYLLGESAIYHVYVFSFLYALVYDDEQLLLEHQQSLVDDIHQINEYDRSPTTEQDNHHHFRFVL